MTLAEEWARLREEWGRDRLAGQGLVSCGAVAFKVLIGIVDRERSLIRNMLEGGCHRTGNLHGAESAVGEQQAMATTVSTDPGKSMVLKTPAVPRTCRTPDVSK